MKALTLLPPPMVTPPQTPTRRPATQRPSVRALYKRWSGLPAPVARVGNRRRRARKVLGQSLALFFLVQGACGLFLAWRGQALRDPQFHARLVRLQNERQAHPERPVVAFVGSSRFLYGLDMGTLARFGATQGTPVTPACFAIHGGGPVTELLMLRRLLRAGVKPDLLVVEMVPSLLDERPAPDDLEEHRLPTASLVVDDVDLIERYGGSPRAQVRHEWWLGNLVPIYTHRFALVSALCPRLLPLAQRKDDDQAFVDLTKGASPLAALTEEQRQRWLHQASREHANRLAKVDRASPASRALFELAELCRREGIAALLLLTPEGPTFQSWYTAATRREQQAVMDTLRRDYGFAVVDAQAWFPDEGWYADSHHLLPRGGLALTERLWQEALAPQLARVKPCQD